MNVGRLVVVLLIAALIAGGVFYLTSTMQPPTQPVASATVHDTTGQKRVLVAAASLPSGTLLKQAATQLEYRAWPAASADDKIYVLEGTPVESFDGAVVRSGVWAGEPVVRANLIKPGESGFLAAVLKPGMRAVSVAVNENTGVAGFVFPGDRVDLVLSHSVSIEHADQKAYAHNVSETILRDLRVVAVDQKSGDQEKVAAVSTVATVEATPEQAERISLAQRMGELRLVLRSVVVEPGSDKGGVDAAGVSATQPVLHPAGASAVDGSESGEVVVLPGTDTAAVKSPDAAGRTFTLDSDLSQIVTPPTSGGEKESNKIQVIRGSETADVDSK